MCNECLQTLCPPECPNSDAWGYEDEHDICIRCGVTIEDEDPIRYGKRVYCPECLDHLDRDDLAQMAYDFNAKILDLQGEIAILRRHIRAKQDKQYVAKAMVEHIQTVTLDQAKAARRIYEEAQSV